MSATGSGDAITKTIVVRCEVEKAFRTWTDQIDVWWPKGHSGSGDPGTTVVIEGHEGGRLYERTPEGVEYDWGRVITWEPPYHFSYQWYLGSSPEQPTCVDVHFSEQGQGDTRVDVSHSRAELSAEMWKRNNSRYRASWEEVFPAYSAICGAIE